MSIKYIQDGVFWFIVPFTKLSHVIWIYFV